MCKVSNSGNIRKLLKNTGFCNLWRAFENMKAGTDFVPWAGLSRTSQGTDPISKSGTSIRKEGKLHDSGITDFRSCFSPRERILLED